MEDAKASGSDWKPNPQLLQQLIDMGISKMAAEHVSINSVCNEDGKFFLNGHI